MEAIILIGHGSPLKDANTLELVGGLLHNKIHPGCHNGCVRVAYLQFTNPGIMETIQECIQDGAGRVVLHPYFLCAGMHVTRDIPEIINEARRLYPQVEFIYTEPLGVHGKLIQVVAERIAAAKIQSPGDIERQSLEIISQEMDFTDVPPEQLPIIKRVIHATADFEFKSTLTFHPDAVKTGIAAIRAGKDILTDIEMVKAGINKKRLERWGGEVICRIRDINSAIPGKTRAETGIESALGNNDNIGIIAIGNAPTALLKTIELFNSQASSLNPQALVIGVPVGFVNALESKSRLAAQEFPFITNLSRKGGTPVAVAIVNALLKMAEGGDK